jgi:hypothetical protein
VRARAARPIHHRAIDATLVLVQLVPSKRLIVPFCPTAMISTRSDMRAPEIDDMLSVIPVDS